MRTMKAGEFKAHCLRVMDEVAASGEEVLITKRGKPVARVSAAQIRPLRDPRESIFGSLRHMVAGEVNDSPASELSNADWDRMFEDRWSRIESKPAQ